MIEPARAFGYEPAILEHSITERAGTVIFAFSACITQREIVGAAMLHDHDILGGLSRWKFN
jgi:hypothetical protein